MNIEVLGKRTIDDPFDLPFELNYSNNPNFTGREHLLDRLDEEIRSQSSKIIILHGMGGIGKTQIALQYVHRHYGEFGAVFWVDVTSEETATLGFRAIAQRLLRHDPAMTQRFRMDSVLDVEGQLLVQKEATRKIVEGVRHWFTQKENQNWLLVLDNLDDLKSFDIRTFIPTASHGKILITSRRKDCTRLGEGLEIEEMLEHESVLLLVRSAGIHCQLSAQGKLLLPHLVLCSSANR